MLSRVFFGKIDYMMEHVFSGELRKQCGALTVSMGACDMVMSGDALQMPPTGGDQLFADGRYRGKGLNLPKGRRGVGVDRQGAPDCHELTHRGVRLRDEFQDAVILRTVHRLDDGKEIEGNLVRAK